METDDHRRQRNIEETWKILENQLTNKGPVATLAFLEAHLNQWTEIEVTIAVTGTTGVGKSTFINEIRGIKDDESDLAEQGRGNTTLDPTYYAHPRNNQIRFLDLPGVGTMTFPKKEYCKKMKLEEYDMFLVFLGLDITEDDLWLAVTLHEMRKPFCFVRSKIDEDLFYARKDRKDPDKVLDNKRKKIMQGIKSNENLQPCLQLFLISSYNKEVGQWKELVSFIENSLSDLQKEALLYTLSNVSTDVIEKKSEQLKSRLAWVTAGCSLISAAPIPFLDVVVNLGVIKSEIKHYIDVFDLRLDEIDKLDGFDNSQLKCKDILDPNMDWAKLLVSGLPKTGGVLAVMITQSITDFALPFVGSAISAATTAQIVDDYLNRVLEDLKGDAFLVYKHIARIDRENSFRI